ncbi:MAG: hypothetical protein SVS85_02855 [Candidatus Nanohaloarchaea archaeon]|nr:hypothetical protein [Candidatus Nanohaloarchaea archaeon]
MRRTVALFLCLLLLSGTAGAVAYGNSTTQKVMENPARYVELYNQNVDKVPGVLRSLVSGERINLHLDTGNGNVTVGVVMDDGRIGKVEEGGIKNPTLKIYTDIGTTEAILDAERPAEKALEAYKSGEIRYRTTNMGTTIKMAVVSFFSQVFGFVL